MWTRLSELVAGRKPVVCSICAEKRLSHEATWLTSRGGFVSQMVPGGSLITDIPLEVKGITGNWPRRGWSMVTSRLL
ncbi:hypothetical protein DVA76_20225, partial [Acinetobacter baumannii]